MPADGQMKPVTVWFQVCAICRPPDRVELAGIFIREGERVTPAPPELFDAAELGADDRSFFLRAAMPEGGSHLYLVHYRLRDYFGRPAVATAQVFAPRSLDRPRPRRFWVPAQ